MVFQIIGALGLISIIIGTFLISKGKKAKRNIIYPFLLIGGILLAIYSIYIKDMIFITLQLFYILIIIYNITKNEVKK
ncbi:MAG: hypothetical protein WDZ69_02420 [Candidatus Pacearchaeota archaeon]